MFQFKIFRLALVALAPVLVFSVKQACAQQQEARKEVSQTFEVQPGTTLDIRNQYGSIEVEQWEGSQIAIRAEVTAIGKDQAAAQQTLDRADIFFDQSGSFLTVQTIFDKDASKVKGVIRSVGDQSKNLFGNVNIRVAYQVKVPKALKMALLQKDGDITLANPLEVADLQIDHQQGNLAISQLAGEAKFLLTGSKATMKQIGYGYFDLKGASEVTIEQASKMDVRSNLTGSLVQVNDVENLYYNGQNDRLEIARVGVFEGKGNLSKIRIDWLGEKVFFEMGAGDLQITQLDQGFEEVIINSKSGDVTLGLQQGASVALEITAREDKLTLPEGDLRITRTTSGNPKDKMVQVKGSFGEGTSPASVKVQGGNGSNIRFSVRKA